MSAQEQDIIRVSPLRSGDNVVAGSLGYISPEFARADHSLTGFDTLGQSQTVGAAKTAYGDVIVNASERARGNADRGVVVDHCRYGTGAGGIFDLVGEGTFATLDESYLAIDDVGKIILIHVLDFHCMCVGDNELSSLELPAWREA